MRCYLYSHYWSACRDYLPSTRQPYLFSRATSNKYSQALRRKALTISLASASFLHFGKEVNALSIPAMFVQPIRIAAIKIRQRSSVFAAQAPAVAMGAVLTGNTASMPITSK